MKYLQEYYWLISLVIAIISILILIIRFEKGRTRTGRIVIISIMTALAVVGRFIPIIKPVAAFAIISGIYLGSETGFMVGAMTALISNIWFGQGPWTPFQMFAWGFSGLIAGILTKQLKNNRILLFIYGAFAGILYSFIMDIWTVLWASSGFDIRSYGAALLTAVPYTISYALSNVLFLLLLFKPIGRRLERIKVKYIL